MDVSPSQRKMVYEVFTEAYAMVTDSKWSWKKGEKARVFSAFKLFAVNCTQNFEECYDLWLDYISIYVQQWIMWDKAERSNFVGFLCKKDRVLIFAKKSVKRQEKKDLVVGSKHRDDYSY